VCGAELDIIYTVEELLRVKFGLMTLQLFRGAKLSFVLDSLCSQ